MPAAVTSTPPALPPAHARRTGRSRVAYLASAVVALGLVIAAVAWWWQGRDGQPATGLAQASAGYVGSAACATCHAAQHAQWKGSHHGLAMQPATPSTVLADFADTRYTRSGVTSTFFRRDDRFFVNTDGPDGVLKDFEIRYTFGVTPLQQYLIALPDGRLQALSIVWDTRSRAEGGQRWYHLYPDRAVKHDDPLHWTQGSQNWNFMCADCHSTRVEKHYDAARNTFATTWSEVSVGCESCHGAGSRHVELARRAGAGGRIDEPANGFPVTFDERRGVVWKIDAASGNGVRSAPRQSAREIETCALCHARRAQIWEGHVPGRPLADTHLPALLSPDLYEADGQMRDEVYNHGTFLQSRMNARGVTCSDCHDPHSGGLRAPGNGVCGQCHAMEKYGAETHHRHPGAPAAQACAACHMPARTYMGVDVRHDHGFRVPRPDLSVVLRTPNACSDCHRDRPAAWAAAAVERWHGPVRKGFQQFAPALDAARRRLPGARAALLDVVRGAGQPAIVRATALASLGSYLNRDALDEASRALADADPLVRIGALRALQAADPAERWRHASRLLDDPVRGVRIEAVSLLMVTPPDFDERGRNALARSLEEYVAVQNVNADRPEAHANLGGMHASRGESAQAEAEYRRAIALDRLFVPAYVNLAELYRRDGRDADVLAVLREGLVAVPGNASLHHVIGLALVREKQFPAALSALARAAREDPSNPRYLYVYAIAESSSGHRDRALRLLEENHRRHPADRDTLAGLAALSRDAGDRRAARAWALQLEALMPGDAQAAALLRDLGPP